MGRRSGDHPKEELNLGGKVVRKVQALALMRPYPHTKMGTYKGLPQLDVLLMEVAGIAKKTDRSYKMDGHWMSQDQVGYPQVHHTKLVRIHECRMHLMCQWVYLLNQQDVQAGLYHLSLHEQRGKAVEWSYEGRFPL